MNPLISSWKKTHQTQLSPHRLMNSEKSLKLRIRKNETVGLPSRVIKQFIESFKKELENEDTEKLPFIRDKYKHFHYDPFSKFDKEGNFSNFKQNQNYFEKKWTDEGILMTDVLITKMFRKSDSLNDYLKIKKIHTLGNPKKLTFKDCQLLQDIVYRKIDPLKAHNSDKIGTDNNNNDPDLETQKNLHRRNLFKFKNVFDSLSNNEDEIIIQKFKFYTLNPKGKFKLFFDAFVLFSIFFSLTYSPLLYSFLIPESIYMIYLSILIDIIFFIDILITFMIPYYDSEENLLHNFYEIFWNYFNGLFLLDLISGIPYNLINYIEINHFSENIQLISWLRVFCIFKLIKNNYIKNSFFDNYIDNTKINRLIIFSIYFLFLVHVCSCFWIYVGNYSPNSQLSWINNNKLEGLGSLGIYVASIYFNLVTIYTIGYGDIISSNNPERMYNCLLLMVGVLLFSFAISNFSTLLTTSDKKEIEFDAKLQLLDDIKRENNLDENLFKNLRKYFKNLSKKIYDERSELLESLPSKLKNEMTITMYKNYIKNLDFFKNKSHEFILFVLPFLKFYKLRKHEKLFSIGEYVEEMYLVLNGRLSLDLGPQNENMEVCQFIENSHFGEIFFLSHNQSPYNLKAKSKIVDLLVLKNYDFLKIKETFSEEIFNILSNSLFLLEKVVMRKKVILEILKIDPDPESVKNKLKSINKYLMIKQFDNYFSNDQIFIDEIEFLLHADSDDLVKIFKPNIKKGKKNFLIKSHTKVSTSRTRNTLLDLENNDFLQKNYNSILNKSIKSLNKSKVDENPEELDEIESSSRNSLIKNKTKDSVELQAQTLVNFDPQRLSAQFKNPSSENCDLPDSRDHPRYFTSMASSPKEKQDFTNDKKSKSPKKIKTTKIFPIDKSNKRQSLVTLFRAIDQTSQQKSFIRKENVLARETKKLIGSQEIAFNDFNPKPYDSQRDLKLRNSVNYNHNNQIRSMSFDRKARITFNSQKNEDVLKFRRKSLTKKEKNILKPFYVNNQFQIEKFTFQINSCLIKQFSIKKLIITKENDISIKSNKKTNSSKEKFGNIKNINKSNKSRFSVQYNNIVSKKEPKRGSGQTFINIKNDIITFNIRKVSVDKNLDSQNLKKMDSLMSKIDNLYKFLSKNTKLLKHK